VRFVVAAVSCCCGAGGHCGVLVECCGAMMIGERYHTGCSRTISDTRRKSPNSEFCGHAVSIGLKSLPPKHSNCIGRNRVLAQFSITEPCGLEFRRILKTPNNSLP